MEELIKQIDNSWMIYHDPKIKMSPTEAQIILNQILIMNKLKELFE